MLVDLDFAENLMNLVGPFVIGLLLGSFVDCLAVRSVHGGSVLRGRSHCDACGHVLGAMDLIPVVSWILLRGRCRYCGGRISCRCPIVELLSAAIVTICAVSFGFSVRALEFAVFGLILLIMSLIDVEVGEIPNRFVVVGCLLFPVFTFACGGDVLSTLIWGLVGGGVIGVLLLMFVLLMDYAAGRDTMGGADIKLLFMTGLYLGWARELLCIVLACVIGICYGLLSVQKRATNAGRFPFIPSISVAAMVAVFWGDALISSYVGFFSMWV